MTEEWNHKNVMDGSELSRWWCGIAGFRAGELVDDDATVLHMFTITSPLFNFLHKTRQKKTDASQVNWIIWCALRSRKVMEANVDEQWESSWKTPSFSLITRGLRWSEYPGLCLEENKDSVTGSSHVLGEANDDDAHEMRLETSKLTFAMLMCLAWTQQAEGSEKKKPPELIYSTVTDTDRLLLHSLPSRTSSFFNNSSLRWQNQHPLPKLSITRQKNPDETNVERTTTTHT